MKFRKMLGIVLAFTMVLSLLPMSALAASYEDAQGHWAEAAIERWSDYGIVTGDERGFRPNDNMTRAEAAKVLCELFGLTGTAGAATFTDVPADAWFAGYIARANAAGIIGGVGDNQAAPNAPLTRETFFVMFARGLGLKEQSTTSGVAADGDSWANGYINALTDKGYVKGDGTGVNALANINRASVMSLLDQTISQYVNESGTVALNANKGIVLVNAKNVTLTGTTNADVVIAKGASDGSVAFQSATVNGAVTVQADNAKVTADKASKLASAPVVNGAGSTYTNAAGTTTGGSGGTGNNTTKAIDWYIDTSKPTTTITAASQLTSSTVDGNLRIGAGLGDGDITLNGVTVNGDLIVSGGGSSSVKLENVAVNGKLIFDKDTGATPRVVAGGTTAIAGGVAVVGDAGAILRAAASGDGSLGVSESSVSAFGKIVEAEANVTVDSGSKAFTLSSVNITGGDVTLALGSEATATTVTVAASADSATITGSNKITTVNAASDVSVANAVGTVKASGSDTTVTATSGTIDAVEVASGSDVTVAGSATVTKVDAAGDVTVATSTAIANVNVTGTNGGNGVTVTAADGATVTAVNVAQAAKATVASSNGGAVTGVSTKGSVTVETDTDVTIPANSSATVTVDKGATIGTLTASGQAQLESGSTGGTVTTLTANNNVTVSGANATVETLNVTAADTIVTVNAGTVDKVDAQAAATVRSTTGNGTVNTVVATTGADLSVDASVVNELQVTGTTGQVTVTGGEEDTIQIEVTSEAAANNSKSIVTSGNVDAENLTVVANDTVTTISIDGTTTAATQIKTGTPDPVAFGANKKTVKATVAVAGGQLTAYSDAALTAKVGEVAAAAAGVNTITLTGANDKVWVTYQLADSGSTTYVASDSVAAEFEGVKLGYKATLDVEGGYVGAERANIDLANIANTATDVLTGDSGKELEWTMERVSGGDTSWLSLSTAGVLSASGTKYPATARDAAKVKITVTNKAEASDTASVTINVGAVTVPVSVAPKSATFLLDTDKTAKTIKVTEASASGYGAFAAKDTIALYSSNTFSEDTLLKSYTVTADDDSAGYATITLTNSPKGNVYVVYTKDKCEAAPAISTNNFPTLTIDDSSSLTDVLITTSSSTDFPSRTLKVAGGVSSDADEVKLTFAIDDGPDWLSIAGATGLTGTISGTAPNAALTKTAVTVSATDAVGQKVSKTFYVTVNTGTVLGTSLSVTGSGVSNKAVTLVAGQTLTLNAVAGPDNITEQPTIRWVSSDTDVATVSGETGESVTVTPKSQTANKTTTITASYTGAESATIKEEIVVTVLKDDYTMTLTGAQSTVQSPASEPVTVAFTPVVKNNGTVVTSGGTLSYALTLEDADKTEHVKALENTLAEINSSDGTVTVKAAQYLGGDDAVTLTVTATLGTNSGTGPARALTATAKLTITAAAKTAQAAPDELTADAPTEGGGKGAIKTTEATMEYAATSDATTWTTCTATSTAVAPGTWFVRYKETDTKLASAAVEVIVPDYAATLTIASETKSLTVGDRDAASEAVTLSLVENGGDPNNSPTAENVTWTVKAGEVDLTAANNALKDAIVWNGEEKTLTVKANADLGEGVKQLNVTLVASYTSGTKTVKSNTLTIPVYKNTAAAPVINSQPSSPAEYIINDGDVAALTVAASADGTLGYQWYSNKTNSASGGSAISGATSESYTPSVATAGETYYYCVVSNTVTGAAVATTTSSVATVTVSSSTGVASIGEKNYTTLAKAVTAAGSADATTIDLIADDTATDTIELPENVTLRVKKGNLKVYAGTLTINGGLDLVNATTLSVKGSVTFAKDATISIGDGAMLRSYATLTVSEDQVTSVSPKITPTEIVAKTKLSEDEGDKIKTTDATGKDYEPKLAGKVLMIGGETLKGTGNYLMGLWNIQITVPEELKENKVYLNGSDVSEASILAKTDAGIRKEPTYKIDAGKTSFNFAASVSRTDQTPYFWWAAYVIGDEGTNENEIYFFEVKFGRTPQLKAQPEDINALFPAQTGES